MEEEYEVQEEVQSIVDEIMSANAESPLQSSINSLNESINRLRSISEVPNSVFSNTSENIDTEELVQQLIEEANSAIASDYVAQVEQSVVSQPITIEQSEEILETIEESVEESTYDNANAIESNVTEGTLNVTTSRFSSAEWYNQIQRETVLLAGIGGIGSYVAFLLSRLNINKLVIFDYDHVDAVNLAGQLYGINDLGNSKTSAITNMIRNYSMYSKIMTFNERYTVDSPTTKIMICGFDNMEARKVFFHNWYKKVMQSTPEEKGEYLFIDGRLAAEEYQILCLKGDDAFSIAKYMSEYLFTDAEADETLCSYKQTTFMANQIASNMVNLFVNFVANKCEPIIDRYLPFYTEYNAETMFYKTVL